MMDSPEVRPLAAVPWLFSRQGLALLLLVTAVAGTYLATDVTYLAGALVLVGVSARAWAAMAFLQVAYTRRLSRTRAFRGDEVELQSALANPRLLPLPWVEVWEQLPDDLKPDGPRERSFAAPDRVWVSRGLALWPYQRLRWRRKLRCARRGVFRLGETRIRTGDPFGFFERERLGRDAIEILVYPRVVPLRRLALPLRHPSLDVVSPSSPVTDPTRTATIREYRPDDPQRLIHWASTARHGTLQVRVLEPATSLHVTLLLDVRGFGFGRRHDELLEQMLSAIASIAVYLQSQSAPIGFLANTDPPLVIAPAASVPHLQAVLESMARLRLTPAARPIVPWSVDQLPRGNTVVLGASEHSPDLARTIARLEEAGFHVVLLLAQSGDGRVRFHHPGAIPINPDTDLTARLEGTA